MQRESRNLRGLVGLSVQMMLVFTSINAALGFLPILALERGVPFLGPLSTLLLFTFCGLGMLLSNYYVRLPLTFGQLMMLGSLGYFIFVCVCLLVSFITPENRVLVIVPCVLLSCVAGVLSSVLYYTQGLYTTLAGGNQGGRAAGISYMVIQGSNLLGNLLAMLLASVFTVRTIIIVQAATILVYSLLALLIPDIPRPKTHSSSAPKILSGLLTSPDFRRGLPLYLLTGLVVATIYGCLGLIVKESGDYPNEQALNRAVFIVLILEGIGQWLGGFLASRLSDRCSDETGTRALRTLFTLLVLMNGASVMFKKPWLVMVTAPGWGIMNCMGQSFALTISGRKQNRQILIAQFNLVLNLSAASFFGCSLWAGHALWAYLSLCFLFSVALRIN